MEVLQINEKTSYTKEKKDTEASKTSEKRSCIKMPKPNILPPVIMTIYSGSAGGTGKSTLAANLAAYIGERYFDVLLVDLDVNGSSSQLHDVELSQDEFGVLEAWLAYDTYAAILLASGDAPVVKPSAEAKGVYVMPPGDVTATDLAEAARYSGAAEILRSLIVRQAEKYRTPLVIIDTPSDLDVGDLTLSFSDMAAVVMMLSFADDPHELEFIVNTNNYLSNMNAVFIVTNTSVRKRVNTPFPVYKLPISPEVDVYSNNGVIFITAEPNTYRGRIWQTELARFAEAVVDKAREISRNKAKKTGEPGQLAK